MIHILRPLGLLEEEAGVVGLEVKTRMRCYRTRVGGGLVSNLDYQSLFFILGCDFVLVLFVHIHGTVVVP